MPTNRWNTGTEYNGGHTPFILLAGQVTPFWWGRLCLNADIISRLKVRFERKPRLGEIILVRDTGAYAAHFYAANTNSFPRPSRVICYEDGSIAYIEKKDTYDEIFSL
jgi:hypothetical protein